MELTVKDRLALDAMKEIVDIFTAGPPDEIPADMPQAMHFVYRAMSLAGVDVSQRRQWMDRVIRLGERDVSPAASLPAWHDRLVLDRKIRFRSHAVGLIASEGDPKAVQVRRGDHSPSGCRRDAKKRYLVAL